MSNALGDLLRSGREAKGLTLEQVAKTLKVSNQAINQWEMGKTRPSLNRLHKISNLYGIPLQEFFNSAKNYGVPRLIEDENDGVYFEVDASGDPIKNERPFASNAALAPNIPAEVLQAQIYLPLDVPVLGVSMGGDGHDFQFNGETVDYIRRPLGIAKAKRAYATYVVGDSMVPAFREGAVLFVNPDRPPSIGDDVVIELHPVRDGEPGPGYIKRLKKRTSTKIIVEQFNPPDDLEFDLADVKAMHRVVPWNELLGI